MASLQAIGGGLFVFTRWRVENSKPLFIALMNKIELNHSDCPFERFLEVFSIILE